MGILSAAGKTFLLCWSCAIRRIVLLVLMNNNPIVVWEEIIPSPASYGSPPVFSHQIITPVGKIYNCITIFPALFNLPVTWPKAAAVHSSSPAFLPSACTRHSGQIWKNKELPFKLPVERESMWGVFIYFISVDLYPALPWPEAGSLQQDKNIP